MKYFIESYGCQLNIAESNALELLLKGAGIEKAEKAEDSDCVIINTCSVRKTAENRIWGRLSFYGTLKRKRKDYKIIVTGCMAERLGSELKKECSFVDAVIGTNSKMDIVDLLSEGKVSQHEGYSFTSSYYKEGEYSSYVPIMNGCNNFCSYCIVPYVRGREVSRPVDDVLSEVKRLDSLGVREITLLGQNVNSYSYEGVTFPDLLQKVCNELDSIEFVRFESPHPKDFSPELISVIRDEERVCSHIHLPMQSGSSRILKLMNRKNTRESFIELVDRMRNEIPGLTFATDVMVGFPSESEEEYLETLSLMDYMHPIEAFMYYWNLREGTAAAKMDGQLDEDVKIARLERLIAEQLSRSQKEKETRKKMLTRALVTGITRDDKDRYLAHNSHNEMISFRPKGIVKPGDMVNLQCYELKGNTYLADEV
ncbi:MAG: tRNA (N6-isopentenyl adenosine(37)-C2)-methylthiotransferase MiaB [Bullifex sp.]